MPTDDKAIRYQLTALLKGGQAHADIRKAMADFPFNLSGERPHGLPYSAWQLLEHMRITLDDLLAFVTDSNYRDLDWPAEYWPKEVTPPSQEAWNNAVKGVEAGLEAFLAQLADPGKELNAPIPWGKHEETLLREILLAADHTSYHTGELVVLRRLLGAWQT